uniref:RING-type E3 ubiquitin transferase n=1 Tax=Tetraselmis sp. GSL018 TaxID=582737 RepID=A0A061RQE4_9CHLO
MSTENKENLALENLNYSEFDALGSDMKSWKGFDWYLCLLDTNHVIFSIGKLRPEYSHIFLSTHVLNRVLLLTIRVFFCRQFPLEEIREEITCPICLDLFQRPCTTACGKAVEVVVFFGPTALCHPECRIFGRLQTGHSFCQECLRRALQPHSRARCPKCRCCLQGAHLVVNSSLWNIVQALSLHGGVRAGEQPALNSKGAPSNPLARRRAGGERSGSGTLGHVRAHYRCMECGFKGCFCGPQPKATSVAGQQYHTAYIGPTSSSRCNAWRSPGGKRARPGGRAAGGALPG